MIMKTPKQTPEPVKRKKPKTQQELFIRLSEIVSERCTSYRGLPSSTELVGIVMEYLVRCKMLNPEQIRDLPTKED